MMSGSNQGGPDDSDGQGGQPQGGQPQSGQPQGSQPQGGQPQGQPAGGQPQTAPPQGGQPGQGGYGQGAAASAANSELATAAKIGGLAYGVVGLSLFVSQLFVYLLGDSSAVAFSGAGSDEFFGAALWALSETTLLVIFLAILIGIYFYKSTKYSEPAVKSAPVAASAGWAVTAVVLLLLVIVFSPDGMEIDIGTELAGFLGSIAGVAATAALTAYLLESDPLDLNL